MPQNNINFPTGGINQVDYDKMFGPPLQASGNLTYIEFISMVKIIWQNAYPDIKVVPTQSGNYASYPVIVYGLELRRPHTVEPKPRTRFTSSKEVSVFGQRFQNIVSFTVITKSSSAGVIGSNARYSGPEAADQIIEIFEDFMLEYTPVFKRLGASELVYARRLSDSEENRSATDVNKRTVTYMLTTEKLFAMENTLVEAIAADVRMYMDYEKSIWQSFFSATPSYPGTEVQVVDLNQGATPSTI